ncbi:hypothetical protein BST97_01755 [Nonlabens spongiae]|uniref:M23ase beta-sheet core domain-containing protein n=1 Tax=Nonlabens spongiae TaxID=331648 RepID=A0A1W6MGT9_9FLAO|nr:peptidoglycan DD-metalloendopeptidase family protein [Nonlabens spongiae]ARN76824.1 hypothetical protein BST97_01755 [Nonlabens spongiae]
MFKEFLVQNNIVPAPVMDLSGKKLIKLDLSKHNQELAQLDLNDESAFSRFISDQLKDDEIGYGGYGEERSLYSRSDLFSSEEPRTIHLGLDLWTEAGTSVFAPLDGKIHSFNNLAVHGDYGPVIILEHQIENRVFYSLYGHLSVKSLENKKVGQEVKEGQEFAWLGGYHENFHWPPHLHFQLMLDLQGKTGDYSGVCRKSESSAYLENCPDPALLLIEQ